MNPGLMPALDTHVLVRFRLGRFDAVRQALLRHKVLFLRGQQHLGDAAHQAFGRRWGEIVPHPTVPAPSGTKIFELDSQHGGQANFWPTDVTFEAAPPQLFGAAR